MERSGKSHGKSGESREDESENNWPPDNCLLYMIGKFFFNLDLSNQDLPICSLDFIDIFWLFSINFDWCHA